MYRSKVWYTSESLQLDTLPIIHGSIQTIPPIPDSCWYVDEVTGVLIINPLAALPDTVIVRYRCLTAPVNQTFKLDRPIPLERYADEMESYIPVKPGNPISTSSGLVTAGNLSRGIGFGSVQDVVLNSNLNLRMHGTLAGDVQVLAAISDENNPVQPEGNTRQVQDFDQVFIQLKRKNATLIAGDFEMKNAEDDYFLRYYKKSRGLRWENSWKTSSGILSAEADVAVARGRFHRQIITAIEGNRGPYRLEGANGELFIIVIAATERIFLDGKLLERGEQGDYIIDYNSGELTFMPRVVISRFSRIIAEFQYSDRNYARSVLHQRVGLQREKTKFYLSTYREADNKNQPFLQSLSGYDSVAQISAVQKLQNSGDAALISIPNVRKSENLPDRVLYHQIVDPLLGLIYVYAENRNADSALYEVVFSYVGNGNGNYRPVVSAANGKVYEFAPPVSGQKQGAYEPVEVLVPPKSQTLTSGGVQWDMGALGNLKLESALSHRDLNTISGRDDGDNTGFAGRIQWNRIQPLDTTARFKFYHKLGVEYVHEGFSFVERFRDPEFNRTFNPSLLNPDQDTLYQKPSAEKWVDVSLGLMNGKGRHFYSRLGYFEKGEWLHALMNEHGFQLKGKKLSWSSHVQMTHADILGYGNRQKKGLSELSGRFKMGEPTVIAEAGRNESGLNNRLNANSFSYSQYSLQFRTPATFKFWTHAASYTLRNDQFVRDSTFVPFTKTENISLNSQFVRDHQRIQVFVNYRTLKYLNDTLDLEENLQARLEGNTSFLNRTIQLQTYLQTGTAREQRREFSYLKVQPGLGIYIWNDYDSNGLASLAEFEPASELDRNRADYVRIFTPVADFVQSVQNQWNLTLNVNLSKSAVGFLRRISSVWSYTGDQKYQGNFQWFGNGTVPLLFLNKNLRGSLFYNRSSPVFGMEMHLFQSENRTLNVYGIDKRMREEQLGRIRWNLSSSLAFYQEFRLGNRENSSEFFPERNYAYRYYAIEPRLNYQWQSKWRSVLFYQHFKTQSTLFQKKELGAELRWMQTGGGIITASLSGIRTQISAEAGGNLAYDLLQGLAPGDNLKWNLMIERRIRERVQITLQYDGRKGVSVPVIHQGRAVARYLF